MNTNEFFVCPYCSNNKIFKVFKNGFQVVIQSPRSGTRIVGSSVLPSLRQADNFVECNVCLRKIEHDTAADLGEQYRETLSGDGIGLLSCL